MYKSVVSTLALSLFLMTFNQVKDKPVQCDGIISEGEWNDAEVHQLTKGGKLLVKKENSMLCAALISDMKEWAHVYLSRGDSIKVMHASAALGSVEYIQHQGSWRVSASSFQAELRNTVYNDETIARMKAYYDKNSWVANNMNMGDGKTIEFKIDLARLYKRPVYFACVWADYNLNLHYFPAGLRDHTLLPRLVQGYPPDSLKFELLTWKTIN